LLPLMGTANFGRSIVLGSATSRYSLHSAPRSIGTPAAASFARAINSMSTPLFPLRSKAIAA
jgi:hypothetical protein